MSTSSCEAFRPDLWVLDGESSEERRGEETQTLPAEGYGTAQSTWLVGVGETSSPAPHREAPIGSETVTEADSDNHDFEGETAEERIEGFEAYTFRSWRVAIYIAVNLLTFGILYAALQSFPSTRVRLLCRRATHLAESSVLLITFRRKKRQGRDYFFVVPTRPQSSISNSVLASYLNRLSTRSVLGQTKRGRQTLQLLNEPVESALVIEARQRRYLFVELANSRMAGRNTRPLRFLCLHIHSAFIPAFEEYYRLTANYPSSAAPSMNPIPENETSLPVAGFQEEDEVAWESSTAATAATGREPPRSADDQPDSEFDLSAPALPLRRPLGLHPWDAEVIRSVVGDNCIDVEVAPLARLFLQCVTHPFFLFQFFSIALWILEQYYYYSATIAFASFLSALLEAMEMRNNAERLARIASSECELVVIRRPMTGLYGDRTERISSQELVPGDVIVIESGMVVPCDCTLLVGSAVVTEANLTGEASPLFKSSWRSAYEEPSPARPLRRVSDDPQEHPGDDRAVVGNEAASPKQVEEATTDAADEDDEDEADQQSTDEGESYFMGAYSASNEAEDLLPTPAFHNMSVGTAACWTRTEAYSGGGTVAPIKSSSSSGRAHAAGQRLTLSHRQHSITPEPFRRPGHDIQAHHLAWDQASHVLYAGTRIIEARPEMTIRSPSTASASGAHETETRSISPPMGSYPPVANWPGSDSSPEHLDSLASTCVLAVVTRTRLDTAKGVLLHQILLADDESSRYERGRSGAERTAVRRRSKNLFGLRIGSISGALSERVESSNDIAERPDSATSEKRLSQMYLDAYQVMIILFIGGLLGALYSFYVLRPILSFREALLSALDVLTIVVPPAMPAAVTFGIVFALERLLTARIFCIRPPAVLIASGLEVVCFDKTGTLTDLGLDVHELLPVMSLTIGAEPKPTAKVLRSDETTLDHVVAVFDAEHALRRPDDLASSESKRTPASIAELLPPGLVLVMSCCHTLTVVNGQVLGDEVDSRLFELTGHDLWPSPREPDAKRWAGIQPPQALFYVADRQRERTIARVVKVFAFSSEHARMGVIAQQIRNSDDDAAQVDWLFLVKGAPEVVINLCDPRSVPGDFVHQVQMYTSQGLRVLALAGRRLVTGDGRSRHLLTRAGAAVDARVKHAALDRAVDDSSRSRGRAARASSPLTWSRRRLERSLTLYGLAVLENRLKPDTAAILHELRFRGDLHCPMVTGDHIRTAISVARQAGMMDRDARVIIVDDVSSHAEQGNRRLHPRSGDHARVAGVEAGAQVVFYDSVHVHKRFSRMEIFSMLAGSSSVSSGPAGPGRAASAGAVSAGADDPAAVSESTVISMPISAVTSTSSSTGPLEPNPLPRASLSKRDATWHPLRRMDSASSSTTNASEQRQASKTLGGHCIESSTATGGAPSTDTFRTLTAAPASTESMGKSLFPSRRKGTALSGRSATFSLPTGMLVPMSFHDKEPVALAMTGAAFRILQREFHRLTANMTQPSRATGPHRAYSRRYHFLRQVFLRCTVYARMSAADKTALIHLLRSRFGLCVGMCGDGANDAGALREADVGIGLVERRAVDSSEMAGASGLARSPGSPPPLESLRIEQPVTETRPVSGRLGDTPAVAIIDQTSACVAVPNQDTRPASLPPEDEDAVASLAAPFTSSVASIGAVVKVIAEGRGAAASSLACFKYMGIYSLTQSLSTLVLYRLGTVYTDSQFLFQDLVLIMPLALTMGRTGCQPRLSRHEPPVRLASFYVCLSMALQSLVQAGFQLAAIYVLDQQDSMKNQSLDTACHWNTPCPAATVLFHVVNLQYIWSAIAFNIGHPFRQPWTRNGAFRSTVVLLLILCLVMMQPIAPTLERVFGLAPLSSTMRRWLWALVGLNGLVTLMLERYLNWREHGLGCDLREDA
jgi:magnesium-transporting ATPase (P-type)